MRNKKTLIAALLAAGLLTAGCGSDSDSDSGKSDDTKPDSTATADAADAGDTDDADAAGDTGKKLPVVVDAAVPGYTSAKPTLKPEPDSSADFTEKVVHELRERTHRMAGAEGKSSGDCEGGEVTMKAGATTVCTVTYEGMKVPWDVTIGDKYKKGSMFVQYGVKAQKGLLTEDGVHGKLWDEYGKQSDELRCTKIPKAELVELDGELDVKCQHLASSGKFEDLHVKVREMGPVLNRFA